MTEKTNQTKPEQSHYEQDKTHRNSSTTEGLQAGLLQGHVLFSCNTKAIYNDGSGPAAATDASQ